MGESTTEKDSYVRIQLANQKNKTKKIFYGTCNRYRAACSLEVRQVRLVQNEAPFIVFAEGFGGGSSGAETYHVAIFDPDDLSNKGEFVFYTWGGGKDFFGTDDFIDPGFLKDIDGDGNREIIAEERDCTGKWHCSEQTKGWIYSYQDGRYRKWKPIEAKTAK
ncbi:MAG: hypothetical protein HYU99_00640 [Deltaproteobacteria bacterium]|nr:hypothetical protein [Deltaproteobacteria bacterium]